MIWRIRSRNTFSELRARGTRVRSGPVRMTFVPVPTRHPQLAFGLGRRFGTAVERNRARRRLRAAFHQVVAGAAQPLALGAYLVSADRSALDTPFPALMGSVGRCLAQVHERVPASVGRTGARGAVASSTASSTVGDNGSPGAGAPR